MAASTCVVCQDDVDTQDCSFLGVGTARLHSLCNECGEDIEDFVLDLAENFYDDVREASS
jgi:hypothetical protein